jgi:hypothetical protein
VWSGKSAFIRHRGFGFGGMTCEQFDGDFFRFSYVFGHGSILFSGGFHFFGEDIDFLENAPCFLERDRRSWEEMNDIPRGIIGISGAARLGE